MSKKSSFDGLKKLSENLKEVAGTNQVKITDLMDDSFISQCSSFKSINELFENSPFTVECEADFAEIPDDEWEKYIVENTSFESWEAMQEKASTAYLEKRIFKGL